MIAYKQLHSMFKKLPFSTHSRTIIFIRAHSSSHLFALSITKQANPNQNNQNPLPNSSEFESLKSNKNLDPQSLIQVLISANDINSSLSIFKWASLQNHFHHTIDTYYHIVLKLGMASRVDEMEGFCNEMVNNRFFGLENVFLDLIECFVKCRKVDEALRVFSVLHSIGYKPSIGLVNRLLCVVVEEKKGIKSVLFVYKEMVKASVGPTIETLNYLLEGLFDAGRIDSALDQYKRIQKKGCCPNSQTYEIMVSCLIGKNFLDEAIVVLNEILENDCVLELRYFSNVLPLVFGVNRHDLGLSLFEKMRTCNIVPDLSVYEVMIKYYSKNLCMDDSLKLYNEMISVDLKPSDCVFVDLVNGFCMLNQLNEAKQFLEDQQVTEANSYNALLDGYCGANNFVEVISLFQKMVENNITSSPSWNILIRYLSESRRNDLVYKALSRMIVYGFMPCSTTYSGLILGKCKSNEIHDALKLFHHVHKENWVVDLFCYSTLVETLCQMDKIQEAVEVFRYMSLNSCMLLSSSFSLLIRKLCVKGKVDSAINLLPLAYYSGLLCSNGDYNIIIRSMSKLYKGNDLLVIVAKMVVQGCPLDSEVYNELIKNMSKHDRAMECASFLNLMVNEGLIPDTEILSSSLSVLAHKSRLHTVLPAIRKLVSFSDHEVLNPAICNTLINGLWKEGYRDESLLLLDLMLEKGWVPDAKTHQLLIHSGASEMCTYEKGGTPDEIASILSEGFGEL